jgi:hypothetical protein
MKAHTARLVRQFHHYIGLFFTPAILFFALSGALQTLGVHENHGPGPAPATWIRWMASIHKDQRMLGPDSSGGPHQDHAGPPDDHKGGPDHDHEDGARSPVPLKAFVVLLAFGLAASSILGVIIALTNRTSRRSAIVALLLGVVVPIALMVV